MVVMSSGKGGLLRDVVVDGFLGGGGEAGLVIFPLLAVATVSSSLRLLLLLQHWLVPLRIRRLCLLLVLRFAGLHGVGFLHLCIARLVGSICFLCSVGSDCGSLLEVTGLDAGMVPLLRWRRLVLVHQLLELSLLPLDGFLSPLDVLLLAVRDLRRNVNTSTR